MTETGKPDDHAEQPYPGDQDLLTDLRVAFAFLTRVPMWRDGVPSFAALAPAMKMFPLVGAFVGLLGGLTYWGAELIGLPPLAAALLALVVGTWATGALHEDGLADLADGFGGGADRETKLAIMHHAQAGAFGVVAVVFAIALKAAALMSLDVAANAVPALVVAGAAARAAMPAVMRLLEPARKDGLAHAAGRPEDGVAIVAGLIALAVALLFLGVVGGLTVAFVAAAATVYMARLADKQIGGYTGDVLGATGVVVETTVLLAIAALMGAQP